MKNKVAVLALVLASCVPSEDLQSSITNTMSGAKATTTDYVEDVVEGVKFVKDDVSGRIDKVGEGIDKIREGKELINEGLSVGGEETGSGQVSS